MTTHEELAQNELSMSEIQRIKELWETGPLGVGDPALLDEARQDILRLLKHIEYLEDEIYWLQGDGNL